MSISIYILPVRKVEELVIKLLMEEYGVAAPYALQLVEKVKVHFNNLKDTIYILAETSYVDKVYRDSYYHYYSSKLKQNKRDCVRISLFDGEITSEDFENPDSLPALKERYRGFIVMRPTIPYIIGRSMISPKAVKGGSFVCCTTKLDVTANGLKMQAEGFPHSSQDTETMSCAETTIWAIMEYFSSKYQEYKPVLPSKIIETLGKMSNQRQIPSRGLTIEQISYALKEFGFGPRIYSKAEYKENFEMLLNDYIESGIPLILGIDNNPRGNIGHAIIGIGHEKVTDNCIETLMPTKIKDPKLANIIKAKNLTIFDWADVYKKLVLIDDNCPIYQRAELHKPTKHYADTAWHTCRIKHFIAPLYPKIHLEAFEARNFIYSLLLIGSLQIPDNSELFIRIFLTSSRSYKNELSLNQSFTSIDLKTLILETQMPKFIWIAELSTKVLIKQGLAFGIVILDATEANIAYLKPLLIGADGRIVIKPEDITQKLKKILLPLHPFKIYSNNLKHIE